MAMNYADRLESLHGRAVGKFGTNASEQQLYIWHNGAQIACYEANRVRSRTLIQEILMQEAAYIIHATKARFTAIPEPGDTVQVGINLATAVTLKIDDVQTTHIRPFYRLSLIDPRKATTAA
jgi:hypothetical protein